MSDFSIDMTSRQIYDPRTNRYFREVYTSYTTGNYRSAVVMLWSVVICDLLFKLDELVSIYGDNTASRILTDIDNQRRQNPKSPEWEMSLVAAVHTNTELLAQAELTNLVHLQNHRHLSAHPVLKQQEVLFSPTADDTRSHIRNALEAVLTKPPIMTKKVFDTLVEELERVSSQLPDDGSLKTYLESKYFPHFVPSVAKSVFRSLWQLVFLKVDARCDANRNINYRTLRILYERHPEAMNDAIRDEPRRFGEIAAEGDAFRHLILFLQSYPSVYSLFDDGARTLIESYANQSLNSYCRCPFRHDSVSALLTGAIELAQTGSPLLTETFGELQRIATSPEERRLLIALGATVYGSSAIFDTADVRFDAMVKPFLDEYEEHEMRLLLTAIEGNDQTYSRGRARADHTLVREAAERIIPNFDITEYYWFARKLTT